MSDFCICWLDLAFPALDKENADHTFPSPFMVGLVVRSIIIFSFVLVVFSRRASDYVGLLHLLA